MADEVLFDALLPPPPLPALRGPTDSEISIEIIWGDDDAAVTGRFVRFSAPYERIELEVDTPIAALRRARPTTFARTVPAPAATVPFERVWFDDEPAVEEAEVDGRASWWWLAVSLLAGAAAVVFLASY